MTYAWRLVVFLYSLLVLFLSCVVIVASIGRPEPLNYINLAVATPQNRIVLGIVAIAFFILAFISLIYSLKVGTKSRSVTIQTTLVGQVSITIAAIKVIIMKAIKKVEGVKEVRTTVSNSSEGLIVNLHIMINPELSVPETSKNIQDIVKQYLEEIGGLPVAEVKVLVDDFGVANKSTM